MNIAIVGTGYVGLSNAVLLAQNHNVIALDISLSRVQMINNKTSPLEDNDITNFLANKNLRLHATLDKIKAYRNADFVILALPTDFDDNKGFFNTELIEKIVSEILEVNSKAIIIIKSTIPIGFTQFLNKKYNTKNIIFSPEFLREGAALYDNLHPSRIIVGEKSQRAKDYANLLIEGAIKKDIEVLFTNSNEAEAIKLFSNTYLAMRVAFFNELDNFALDNKLNTKDLINGICMDSRIGNFYNNPSFGFGGYCLPKDTKQLLFDFNKTSQNIIKAIVKSNETRKEFIAKQIMRLKSDIIGVYRLSMKSGSDNYRNSSIIDVIKILYRYKKKIIIFEPNIKESSFLDFEVVNKIEVFKKKSDLIITNRMSDDLKDISEKIFSRDLFGNN